MALNNKGEAPSTIIISCLAMTIILVGMFFVATSSTTLYNNEMNDTFKNTMDKSSALKEIATSANTKIDGSKGMQDPGTGVLLFDGLNTIVLGFKAVREVVYDYTVGIGQALGISPLIVQLIVAILFIVIITSIISALWSRDV
jgi:hypothetical protein